jgi:hypothetical protein
VLKRCQPGVLMDFVVFALPGRPERTGGETKADGRRSGGVRDGEVEEKGMPVEGETKIWPHTIHRARLRDGLKTGLTEERDKELKKTGVTRSDGVAP